MSDEYPETYLHGIQLFNDEEFFECHDVLEELWAETLGEERKFYQGLIQASVALFHFGNENLGGARKMYESARRLLEPYGPQYLGLDLETFLAEFQRCFQDLIDAGNVYPKGITLQDDRIPKINIGEGQAHA